MRSSDWSSDGCSSDLLVLLDQADQFACIGVAVILVLQHHIFESDAPGIVRTRISGTGRQQFLNTTFAVDRHDIVTDLLRDGMEQIRQVTDEILSHARQYTHPHTGCRSE